jgi:hypothetical protein
MKCESCNKECVALVQGCSFIYYCQHCKWYGPATSFMGILDRLSGLYEIMEMDEEINPIQTIGIGDISDYKTIIETASKRGILMGLKKILS